MVFCYAIWAIYINVYCIKVLELSGICVGLAKYIMNSCKLHFGRLTLLLGLTILRWVSKLIRKRHESSVTNVAWHPNNVSTINTNLVYFSS